MGGWRAENKGKTCLRFTVPPPSFIVLWHVFYR
uniref:Uncharacterized protein n=1 Tax=Anguilla anguilla TaxID=7936 RepID=A0A0E9VA73_ANGAN